MKAGWGIPGTKTERYGKWYVFVLFVTGLMISFAIFKLMGKTEQNAYISEVKIEASSLAMSLDLIMANHAIKMQNFEDHLDLRRLKSTTNRQVIQAAFDHSIFSSFSFYKYKGLSREGEVVAERLLRVVANDKPTPQLPANVGSAMQAKISRTTLYQMVKKGDKQGQFLVEVNGQVLYAILSRSVENDRMFYAFSGFAKNLFNENFPAKTSIEGIIHQFADDTYWHVVKKNTETKFEKIPTDDLRKLLRERMVFQYLPRFGSGKYFDFQVLVPKSAPQKNLLSIIVLVSGIVITLLLCSLLHYLITRNILIHNIVRERTFELEEESKKSKEAAIAKSRFLANISHEIRTPLNIVLGMTDLLSETTLTSMQKHYLNSINNSGRHLLHLINDILDMTRVDVSEVAFKPEMVSLLQVVEDSGLAVDELARNKNLDLYIDLEPSLPHLIEIDPARVRQVLINLLSNAVKYTEKGFIEFSATGKTKLDTGQYYLEFRVKDSGIGISDKDKEEIFKAFYQVNTSIQRAQGGVGLGLSIVASIVKRLGGTVDVQSTLGIGSTFIVNIPLKKYVKETWSSKLTIQAQAGKENIFISNDTIMTGIFAKYMKSMKIPLNTYNSIQGVPVHVDKVNCVFVDMDTVHGFNKGMLGSLKYEKLICIGEPADSPDIFSKQNIENLVLWPNKLLLPSKIFDAIETPFKKTEVVKSQAEKQTTPIIKPRDDIRILIVDDDTSNKILFQAYCAKEKWKVDFASNGQEAIDNHLSQKHYDILITDLQMPVMDGFTLIQQLNDEDQKLHKPDYTIILSADSTEETINMSKTLDVDAFLAKPIRKSEFLNAIEKASQEC